MKITLFYEWKTVEYVNLKFLVNCLGRGGCVQSAGYINISINNNIAHIHWHPDSTGDKENVQFGGEFKFTESCGILQGLE